MTPADAVAAFLAALPAVSRLALVEDPLGLLPDESDLLAAERVWRLVPARGNLAFRLRWESLRESAQPILVARQRADLFLPDIEANAAARLALSPRELLRLATGEVWPDWVDQEGELLRERYGPILRGYRQWRARAKSEFGPAAAEGILLRALLGADLAGLTDVADIWQAFFRNERLLRRLHPHRSRLTAQLTEWLARQRPPVNWLRLDDPGAAARLTWLAAILQPHLSDLSQALPRLYPGAVPLDGEDATAVARVAYRLERLDPELAAAQRDLGEAVIEGPLRAAVVRLLQLTEPAQAAALLRRESRSGHLLLLALRALLAAFAADRDLQPLGLDGELAHLAAREAQVSHADEVGVHRRLLAALLRLSRVRGRLTAALAADESDSVARLLSLYLDGEAVHAEQDLAAARDALTDNALADLSWDPQPDAGRHKAVVTALYHHLQLADEKVRELHRRFARCLLAGPPGRDVGQVEEAWDQRLTPLREERGEPRTCLVVVAGLSWAVWDRALARHLGDRFELEAEPLLAPVPACGSWSLRRAVGGMRWREGAAGWELPELLGRLRPELALTRRPPPKPFAALAQLGATVTTETSRPFCLVQVDLLAGSPTGLPLAAYEARLEGLRTALLGLADSGRRDELIGLLGSNGAVACLDAPGEALAGQPVTARCLRRADAAEPPAGARAIPAPDGTGRLWLAEGSIRLAPAAPEQVMADGGLSLSELTVPLVWLTPLPKGERSAVEVGNLGVAEWLTAGEPTELVLPLTLVRGALAEVAEVVTNLPGAAPRQVTLDLGEPRRIAVTFRPVLPAGRRREEQVIEASCRIGRRTVTRRALVMVVAPADVEPAPPTEVGPERCGEPAGESDARAERTSTPS